MTVDVAAWGEASARRGASVVEAIVALLIGLFVLQLGLETLARLRGAYDGLLARADALVALRIGRYVVREELRRGRPGVDWSVDADSLSLRAFRGVGVVCAYDAAKLAVVVSYRGERAPDPAKDSVLVIESDGAPKVLALLGTSTPSAPCGALEGGESVLWRLDGAPLVAPVVARVFERGSYHLSGSALRYRRGASGRQPLTPEVWSGASSWNVSRGRLGATLVSSRGVVPPWSGFLAWR